MSIGFDGAVSNGGAFATYGEEIIVSRLFTPDAVQRLQATFERHGIAYFQS